MLKSLSVQNLALAQNIFVEFLPGFNVITGETGAGKSLLVDALGLLRGARGETSLIRTGADTAQVVGVFALSSQRLKKLIPLLETLGLNLDVSNEDIFLRRQVNRQGRSLAFINDFPVTLKTLETVASELIDLTSQFDQQKLLDAKQHVLFLDQFSGCEDLFSQYQKYFLKCQDLFSELDVLMENQARFEREKRLAEFEWEQIEEGKISKEEFLRLEEQIALGQKSASLQMICQESLDILHEGEVNIKGLLQQVKKNIEKIERQVPQAAKGEQTDEIFASLENLESFFYSVQKRTNIDEESLFQATQRMEKYNTLLQKFGPRVEDILTHQVQCQEILTGHLQVSQDIETKQQELAQAMVQAITLGRKLSESRQKNVEKLNAAITKELVELGMKGSQFVCALNDQKPTPFSEQKRRACSADALPLLEEFSRLTKFGFEAARFLLSANPGQEPQPLEKVASGGELSRTMLAIKQILYHEGDVGVFVFDEVDTGISGSVAAKVGKKLKTFCANRQALCVTHLPQVASYGRHHFIVRKEVIKPQNITQTNIFKANADQRIEAVAGLLAGETISAQSLAQAKALLDENSL